MDVKFDRNTAVRLIREIDGSCDSMVKDTRALIKMLKQADAWNDYQKQAFERNINVIAQELNQTLTQEEEYMKIYYERVQELGG